MDYEKLHKDTIAKLQEMVNSGKITVETACGICSDFVPESEDERIRQFLIQQVTETSDEIMSYRNMNKEDVLAWLEKQGEQKPVEPQQDMLSQEKYAKAVDECIYGEQKPVNVDYVSGIREELLSIEDSAENIVGLAESQWVAIRAAHRLLGEYIAKEQKLADKVEPKFKVGDCIRHKGADECYIIVTIDDNYYFCENNHAWSIRSQDCFELVEQKSYWGEEDERIYKVIVELLNSWSNGTIDGCIIPPNTDRYINWLKSLKDRVEPQPKQEWSEDDVNTLNSIINYLEEASGRIALPNLKENYIRQIDWLKSLRPQPHWKPSKRQKEALLWCVVHLGGANKQTLGELLEELNKL